MIQEHYGKYIRDDGDALLRANVEKPELTAIEQKTGTFSRGVSNFVKSLASPTGFEVTQAPFNKLPELPSMRKFYKQTGRKVG
jgi:hypothetical protein